MAYSKTKVATTDNSQEAGVVEKAASEPVSEAFKPIVPKKKIPLDAQIMVKNLTGGKLVYESKRLQGYSEEWHEFGEEIPMEMAELYSMKNTDRRFFTENWVEVDMAVLRDLQMDRYYENAITVDEINHLADIDVDAFVKKINGMSLTTKNCVGIRAMQMIAEGTLTNINTISALEKALGCELYDR